MNKGNLFYLILFVITFIPMSISMMASSGRKPSNQDNPFAGASAPTIVDDSDPYAGASAPPLEQDNGHYQGYPDLNQQDNNGLDPYKASFLTAQQMEEFMSLSPEDQQALSLCSIEEIKHVLNERLTQKTRKQAKDQTQFDRDTEEALHRSAQEYEDEQLQQAIENSKHENYAHKRTWAAWFKSWWLR